METIILVTVLSTLGVVALVTAIEVAFMRLKKKVDVNNFEREINSIYQQKSDIEKDVYNRIEELSNDIYRSLDSRAGSLEKNIDEVVRFIDSRCDKLDNKIKELHKERSLITEQ